VLQPANLQKHNFSLPTFWLEDPVGWFEHDEAEFVFVRVLANASVSGTAVHGTHRCP
jgi:hypothetical protein